MKKQKHYRKFGKVTLTSGKETKIIKHECWARIRPDTGECLFDETGMLITKKIEREEK